MEEILMLKKDRLDVAKFYLPFAAMTVFLLFIAWISRRATISILPWPAVQWNGFGVFI